MFPRMLLTFPLVLSLFGVEATAATLQEGDLLVVDIALDALLLVDRDSGDREVVSSASVGTGPAFVDPFDVSVGADGTIHVLDRGTLSGDWQLFRVDAASGDRTVVSSPGVGSGPNLDVPARIALEADGNLVVTDQILEAVARIDATTGDRTIVSSSTVGSGPALAIPIGIGVSNVGDLYVARAGVGMQSLLKIDPATGDRTVVSGGATGAGAAFTAPVGLSLALMDFDFPFFVADMGAGNNRVFQVRANGDRVVVTSPSIGTGPVLTGLIHVLYTRGGEIIVADVALDALFRVDAATGDRTAISGSGVGSGPAFDTPVAIAEAPLRAPQPGDIFAVGTSALFRIDPVTGDRVVVSEFGFGFGPTLSAGALAVRSDGVGFDLDTTLSRIDLQSGDRALVSPGTFGSDVTLEKDGKLIVVEGSDLVRVDPATGDRTIVSSAVPSPVGVGVASNGTLFVSSLQLANSALYEVDPGSGVANLVAALPDFPIDVEIEAGDVPIVAISDDGVYRVPGGFVSSTGVGSGPAFGEVQGIAVEADGDILVPDDLLDRLLRVDPVTGDRTELSSPTTGAGPPYVGGFDVAVFPEPAPVPVLAPWAAGVCALFMGGAGGALLRRRAQRRRSG